MNTRNPISNALGIAAVAMATVVLTTSALADFTIYSDDFSGSGGALHGTIPDIAYSSDPFVELSWNAALYTFFDDGTVNADPDNPLNPDRGGGGAYLPFVPDAGHVYTLSADINNLQRSWVGIGFVETPDTIYIDDDSGRQEQDGNGTQWFQFYPGSASFMSGKSVAWPAITVGDFNKDGIVDSVDLSDPVDGWEARFGVDLDGSDFLVWQRNLGKSEVKDGTRIATVDGLTGTNSVEIILDTNDVNNVMVAASINATPVDLDPDSGAFDYNAGPLATMGTGGDGIQGLGFSVRGIGADSHTLVDGLDNLLLTSDGDVPPVLGLEVDTSSGEITMNGNGSSADNINYYQITSDLNQLDPTEGKWYSLDDQDFPTSAGSTGWEEGGSLGPHVLAEGILEGESTIDAGASISLGDGYTGPATGDLTFIYRTADGSFLRGDVSYVGAAAAAVPEPSSLALIAVGLLGLGTRRRKQA